MMPPGPGSSWLRGVAVFIVDHDVTIMGCKGISHLRHREILPDPWRHLGMFLGSKIQRWKPVVFNTVDANEQVAPAWAKLML